MVIDKWARTLEVAQHLAELNDNTLHPEIVRRAAISRAYYAAFLVARQISWDRDPNHVDDGASHDVIIRWWQSRDTDIARILRHMRDKRVDADYHAYEVPHDTMVRVVTKCELVIGMLKEANVSMQ